MTGPLEELVAALARLPGLGRRSAERLAYHLLAAPEEEVLGLAGAIRELVTRVRPCRVCHDATDREVCEICEDASRDRAAICVVETPRDRRAVEESSTWRGLYHVLGGRVSPLSGNGPVHLSIKALLARARGDEVREVVLALAPNAEGDATAAHLAGQLRPLGVRLTRPARGLVSGGEMDFAPASALADAMNGRREV